MIDSHKIDYSKLDTLNVSRETFHELDEFKEMILDENKKINLISQHTEELARDRHIIDCAQIIDLIDENHLSCTDLGSGSGLPGLVLAIIKKKQKSKMKFFLYEKSFKKSNFLKKVINKFELNAEVINKNIFDQKKLNSDLIVARAFKPLPVILDLVTNNFDDFKDIILFLGKSGKSSIEQSLNKWNLEHDEIGIVTDNGLYNVYNNDSIVYSNKFINFKETDNNLDKTYNKEIYSIEKINRPDLWTGYDHTIGCRTIKGPGKPGQYSILDIYEINKKLIITWSTDVENCYNKIIELNSTPLGIVNCLNFGDPMSCIGDFESSIKNMNETCMNLKIPVLGGNVSMYNSTNNKDITPSVVLVMIGLMDY